MSIKSSNLGVFQNAVANMPCNCRKSNFQNGTFEKTIMTEVVLIQVFFPNVGSKQKIK